MLIEDENAYVEQILPCPCQVSKFFTITARWHDYERMEIGRDLPVMADDWEINRFLRIFCRRRRDDELFQEHVKLNDAL